MSDSNKKKLQSLVIVLLVFVIEFIIDDFLFDHSLMFFIILAPYLIGSLIAGKISEKAYNYFSFLYIFSVVSFFILKYIYR